MPRVFIPPQMRDATGGVAEIDVDGTTVRQVIAALEIEHPDIRQRLCDGDRILPTIKAVVDGAVSPRGMLAKVGENSEVHFLPAIGGG